MRNGIARLIIAAHTLDKMERQRGVKPQRSYMSSLPWGQIAFCTGLGIFNHAVGSARRDHYRSNRRRYSRKHF